MAETLMEVKNLQTYYFGAKNRVVKAVDGVDMVIRANEVVGLVGESGCGKSATGLSIMRLTPPPGRVVQGEIKYGGMDLAQASEEQLEAIRGQEIAMVFQDPMTSLNPAYPVGWQIREAIQRHKKVSNKEANRLAVDLLKSVGIAAPAERAKEYPHRLSGGMRQRVMIAMALSCQPKLLIADEPTTALDVTVQAQILDLLRSLQQQYHMSVILVSHNLGVVAEMAQRVIVMYAGQIVEEAPVTTIFATPQHPYTKALLASIPGRQEPKSELQIIKGKVPDMVNVPSGCRFHPRCQEAKEECRRVAPQLTATGSGHQVRCLRAGSKDEVKA